MMDFDEYKRAAGWNFSTIKHGLASMAHLREHQRNPKADRDTTDRASLRLYHAAIVEPDRLLIDFKAATSDELGDPRMKRNLKAGKDEWAAHLELHPEDDGMDAGSWQALCLAKWNPGKTVVSGADYMRALKIRDAVRRHPRASKLIASGIGEHTIQWTHRDSATGREMPCKGRLDFKSEEPAIVDLKGIGTDPRMVRRIATSNLYFAQLGMYAEGLAQAERIVCPVYLLAYEVSPPFDVGVFRIRETDLAVGWETMRRVLEKIAACEESGVWPGRCEGEQVIEFPPWINPDYEPGEGGYEVVPNEEEA